MPESAASGRCRGTRRDTGPYNNCVEQQCWLTSRKSFCRELFSCPGDFVSWVMGRLNWGSRTAILLRGGEGGVLKHRGERPAGGGGGSALGGRAAGTSVVGNNAEVAGSVFWPGNNNLRDERQHKACPALGGGVAFAALGLTTAPLAQLASRLQCARGE